MAASKPLRQDYIFGSDQPHVPPFLCALPGKQLLLPDEAFCQYLAEEPGEDFVQRYKKARQTPAPFRFDGQTLAEQSVATVLFGSCLADAKLSSIGDILMQHACLNFSVRSAVDLRPLLQAGASVRSGHLLKISSRSFIWLQTTAFFIDGCSSHPASRSLDSSYGAYTDSWTSR